MISLSLILGWLTLIYLLNKVCPIFPIQWAYATTFEFFAFFGIHHTLLTRRQEAKRGKGTPILLVAGYLHHPKVWYWQKKWLEALHLGPIYTVALGGPFESIRSYAEKIKEKAEAIAQETGQRQLILVGHSMGGLVASWYATKLAPPDTVTHLITIASPLRGTPIARIGLGANAREMEPESPFLQELRTSLQAAPSLDSYHIATETDLIVIPGKSGIIEEKPHHLFRDIGHTALLFSRRIPVLIKDFVLD